MILLFQNEMIRLDFETERMAIRESSSIEL